MATSRVNRYVDNSNCLTPLCQHQKLLCKHTVSLSHFPAFPSTWGLVSGGYENCLSATLHPIVSFSHWRHFHFLSWKKHSPGRDPTIYCDLLAPNPWLFPLLCPQLTPSARSLMAQIPRCLHRSPPGNYTNYHFFVVYSKVRKAKKETSSHLPPVLAVVQKFQSLVLFDSQFLFFLGKVVELDNNIVVRHFEGFFDVTP